MELFKFILILIVMASAFTSIHLAMQKFATQAMGRKYVFSQCAPTWIDGVFTIVTGISTFIVGGLILTLFEDYIFWFML